MSRLRKELEQRNERFPILIKQILSKFSLRRTRTSARVYEVKSTLLVITDAVLKGAEKAFQVDSF
jgi:hypothetical protein